MDVNPFSIEELYTKGAMYDFLTNFFHAIQDFRCFLRSLLMVA